MNPSRRISKNKSKTQQTIEWFVAMDYAPPIDPKAVNRFINNTLSEEETCQADKAQIAALLTAITEGTKAGDDMSVELQRILGIRKNRRTKFDPNTAPLASLECHVVTRYVLGMIRWTDAMNTFMDEFGYEETTAQRYIRKLKPRIEEAIAANPQYYENYLQI